MKKSKEFLSNLNFILINLEKDIKESDFLEDKKYIELTKKEIINYLNSVYMEIKSWKKKYNDKNYVLIIDKYKEIESIISELELCLADYEDKFHMNGISYSIYQIGEFLVSLMKEGDKNER